MKICFLAHATSIHSYRWIEYLAERDKDCEIHWISLMPNNFDQIKNVRYYQFKNFFTKPLDVLFNMIAVRRLIKKISPDFLHAHYAGVNGMLGALSGFHPFILTAYGSDIFLNSKSKIKRRLIKFILRKADLITCNSKVLAEEMTKLGINPQKIKFIYWATDVEKFKPLGQQKKLKKDLGILNSPVIISLRNLEPFYSVETLIKAIPLVLKKNPEAKFLIGGRGSQKRNIERLSKRLGVYDDIKFIGWISYDELPKYLNLADIYVSTSLSDGDLSQNTQEAMACQVPIITTDIAVNKIRIKEGENGLFFPQKDYKILAKKIIKLLGDEELRKRLGRKGRTTIKKELNFFKEMERANNLFKEWLKNYENK